MNLKLSEIAGKLTPRQWIAFGGAAAVTIIALFAVVSLASAPSYSTVLAGINPAQTGKITNALSTAGIPYELENGGTAIGVQSDKESQARVVLGTAGLLSGGGNSSALSSFNQNSSLGESSFQTQVAYQSALEQQLGGAIENFQGINSAQVQLVLPDPSSELFAGSSTPASGAVLLNDTTPPSGSEAKAIAELVAGSVPSLDLSKVTITDQNGTLLWPAAGSESGPMLAKEQAQEAYDAQTAAQVEGLLAGTLGANKVQVQIAADLNTNQTTQDSVTYANKGVPLTSTTSNETLTGAGAGSGGTAGTTQTQIPAYAAGTNGSGNQRYQNKSAQIQYGVNKTVAHTVVAPGAVNRQSVSVLVSSKVPASELPAIQSAVENAVGFSAKRGDTIAISQVKFAPVKAAPATASPIAGMMGYLKYLLLGLGALIFLMLVSRSLRRRENETFSGRPLWLTDVQDPRPLAELEAERLGGLEAPARVAQLRSPVNVAKQQVAELAERDPDRIAAQVRLWMAED